MLTILLWILFAVAVGAWAQSWNRSFGGYLLVSLIVSPILGAIILLCCGKNDEAEKAEESKKAMDVQNTLKQQFMDLYLADEDKHSQREPLKKCFGKLINNEQIDPEIVKLNIDFMK